MTMQATVFMDIREKVMEALETIRPFLKTDGGDVQLLEITKDMTVRLNLLGQCRSCHMSEMTMKAGIEDAIRRAVPEIKSVIAVNEA